MSLPAITTGLVGLNLILTATTLIMWRMWRTERGQRRYIQSIARLRYNTTLLAAQRLATHIANATLLNRQ